MLPGPLGAHNWQPMSYSPQTGYVYIPALEAGFGYAPVDTKALRAAARRFWNLGVDPVGSAIPDDEATRKAIRASTKGRLVAWDPIARKPAWTVEHPLPWNGGLLSTASGLRVPGQRPGPLRGLRGGHRQEAVGLLRPDRHHRRARHLRGRWRAVRDGQRRLGRRGTDRRRARSCWTRAKGSHNRVLTFKLGGKAELPPLKTAARPLDPPPATAPAEKVADGKRLYQTYCIDVPRRHRRVGRHGAGPALLGDAGLGRCLEVDRARRHAW